jgi:hypothetical protein
MQVPVTIRAVRCMYSAHGYTKHVDSGAVCRVQTVGAFGTRRALAGETDGSRRAGGERARARALLPSTFEGVGFYSNSHGIAALPMETLTPPPIIVLAKAKARSTQKRPA